MPLGLLDRLDRILTFADTVMEEIVMEETDLLDKTIPRMFEVILKTAEVSCDYVRRGRWSPEALTRANNRSEDGRQVGLPGCDRRNGQRVDEGYRGLRPCSEH
jgi:hypothetical protein